MHGPHAQGGAEFASSAQGLTSFSSLASAEAVLAARGNRIGHQGLRAERYDRPWAGSPMSSESPLDATTASPYSTGAFRVVYHNRNRMYDPAEGRFLSQDPNGLGLPVLGSMAYGGVAISAWHVVPSAMSHFGDGMNAHLSYGSQPTTVSDPLGLLIAPDGEGFLGPNGEYEPNPNSPEYRRRVAAAQRAARQSGVLGRAAAWMRGQLLSRPGGREYARGAAINLVQSGGRVLGAYFAAWMLGDLQTGSGRHVRAGYLFDFGLSLVPTFAAGLGLGAEMTAGAGVTAGKDALDGGLSWDTALNAAKGFATDSLEEVVARKGPLGLALPILGIGAMYGGALEYMADTAFDWWKPPERSWLDDVGLEW